MTNGSYKDDYEALLEMARDKTVANRARLAAATGDLFSQSSHVLTDHERVLMSDILRRLLHDTEMSVRRNLSTKLAAMDNVPHDLIVTLANDDIEVAHPILEKSELLQDSDLIEIIRHRTLQHQLSIAMRRSISESVTDALVENGDEDVIKALLENTNACISKATMEYLVEQAKRVDTYQNPILHRPDLDPEVARRMYWWVSAAVRKHLIERFDIEPTNLDQILGTRVTKITDQESEASVKLSKAGKLAQLLDEAGWLTSETMIRVLRQGEVPLFEAMFVEFSGLRLQLLRRILFESGGEALAVVCKGMEIPKDDFATIFMLTRKAESGERTIHPSEVNRVLELYERVVLEAAQAMLGNWQRDPEFLDAVRVLSAGDSDSPDSNLNSDSNDCGISDPWR
jgi:uncharacterized protein (DUF2336 family)